MIDFIKKLIRFALLLLMDFDSLIEEYLGRFHAEELKSCEPNEDRGKNRCVYENHLDDKEYVDRGNNPNGTTIKSIICPDREHDQEKQILCISAAPGYGKEFFAKRLCLLDYKAYYDTQHKGRVPFIIKSVDVDSFEQIRAEGVFEGYEPLCALCTISMNRVLQNVGKEIIDQVQPFKANKFILRKLLKRLEQLLSSGQLFVLFEKEVNIQSVRELTRTFCVIPEDLRDLVQKNLLVFVFDDGRLNPFNYGAYSVVLFRLSNQDVIRHIEFCTQGNSKIVEEFKHLVITIPALNIPDCLLFITETHLGNLQNIKQAKTAAGLYQDCIRCVIENRSEDPEERQRTRDHLQNQAMSSYYEKYGYTDFGVLLSSEERELLCAQATRSDHLLHDDGQFRFEGCRDYLIAEKLYWMLQDDRRVEQTRNLLRCTDDNIMKRLIEIVVQDNKKGANVETSVSILEEIWSNLISPDRAAAGTNLEILTYFMEHIAVVKGVDKEEAFIKQIRLQMSKPVYDGNIFELISKADSSLSGLKINEKLKKIYLDSVRNRDQNCDWKAYEEEDLYNRRFLFYLGVYGELTTDVLEGLTNSYL